MVNVVKKLRTLEPALVLVRPGQAQLDASVTDDEGRRRHYKGFAERTVAGY